MLWQNDNAIIIGKNQNTAAEINAEYVREHGISVVRRLSGGGAVYHDLGNINFTFIADAANVTTLNLQSFCVPIVKVLETFGVHAQISGRNDITINGKKFSGNSQYLKEGRVMHHGTIMFNSDLTVVTAALNVPKDKIESNGVPSVRSRVTNVKEYVSGNMSTAQFWNILKQYMVDEQEMDHYNFTDVDLAAVEKLRRERYDTWDWNYGASPRYSIHKERRVEGCGKIEVDMDVEQGVITAFATYGDYFGSGEQANIVKALIGHKMEEMELLKALAGIPICHYYNNLTREQLVAIILQ